MQKSYSAASAARLWLLLALAFASNAGAVTIKGTITDASRGVALPSMIAAAYTPSGTLVQTTTSDSQGRYIINVPAGRYRILGYDLNGAYATTFSGGADSFDTCPIVNATTDVSNVNFSMVKAGTVSGHVTSATLPLSHMTVAAYNLASGTRRGFTQTAADGSYSLALPPGDYKLAAYDDTGTYAVSFFQSQITYNAASVITLTSGQQATADFELPQAGHLSGSVIDAETNGILPSATVLAYTTDGLTLVASTTADTAGNFTLAVPPGSYKVVAADATRVYAAGYLGDVDSFANETAIAVAAGQSIGAIRIPLHRAGAVSGRAIDSAGNPVSGISVAAYNDDGTQRGLTTTDVNGTYSLLLPPGSYRIAAYDPSLVFSTMFYPQRSVFPNATSVVVLASQTTASINFTLVRGAHFSGTITDASSGSPIAGVSVGAYDDAGNLVSVATSDSSGKYAIVVPSGSYKLAAFDNLLRYITGYGGGAPNYDSASVFQTDGTTQRQVDFALTRGVHISGQAIDSTSAFSPVSDVQIGALDLNGDRVATAFTHDSNFDLVLAPGTYKLLAVDPLGRYFAMFYNGAWTLQTASPVTVQANGLSTPITLQLIRVSRRHPARH